MKKLYFLIFAVLFVEPSIAQRSINFNSSNKIPLSGISRDISSGNFQKDSSSDTRDTTFYIQFYNGTWDSVWVHSFSHGFIFGSNDGDLQKAQGVIPGDALHPDVDHVIEAFGFFTYKSEGAGNPNSMIIARIYEIDTVTGLPGNFLASVDIPFTNIARNGWTWAVFQPPPLIRQNQAYAVGYDISTLNENDSVAIYTSDYDEVSMDSIVYDQWEDGSWGTIPERWEGRDFASLVDIVYNTDLTLSAPGPKPGLIYLKNSPNPFKDETLISYKLESASQVSLEIYDISGRQLENRNEGEKTSGIHTITVNGSEFSPGVYFYKLNAGGYTAVKKMAVVK